MKSSLRLEQLFIRYKSSESARRIDQSSRISLLAFPVALITAIVLAMMESGSAMPSHYTGIRVSRASALCGEHRCQSEIAPGGCLTPLLEALR